MPKLEPSRINFQGVCSDVSFTGRSSELLRLKDTITERPNVVVVSGLGGIGKTQLVRKYADENRSFYNNVIWINSEKRKLIEEAFITLAKISLKIATNDVDGKRKEFKSIVEEVFSELSESPTLIVFDNADKEETADFIPFILKMATPNLRPHIVITSRIQDWSDSIPLIKLNVFTDEDAVEFLSKTLIDPENTYHDSFEDKMALTKILQSFPLALRQATAHINCQRKDRYFDIADYIEEYNSFRKELLDSGEFTKDALNSYEKTTFTTWRVTMTAINKCGVTGAVAQEILRIIAYFDPDHIRRDIFFNLKLPLNATYKWIITNDLMVTTFRLLAYLDPDPIRRNIFFNLKFPLSLEKRDTEQEVRSAVKLLVNYSMVDSQDGRRVLSIHRLVQQVTKIEIDNVRGMTKKVLREGLRIISEMNEYASFEDIPQHGVSVFLAALNFNDLVKEFPSFPAIILNNLLGYFKYSQAKNFGDEILKRFTAILGKAFLRQQFNLFCIQSADLYFVI